MATWQERENQPDFSWDNWIGRARIMRRMIPDDVNSVLDLGAGGMVLKKMLPSNVAYYPVDYTKRYPETIVADFNQAQFPDIKADLAFCAGILEYVKNVDWFVDQIINSGCKYVLLSYCIFMPSQSLDERRAAAWLNDYSINDIARIFGKHGFVLTEINHHYSYSPIMKFQLACASSIELTKFCTGCSACASSCPVNAIKMIADEDGFMKPSVDKALCISCNKCISVCPATSTIDIKSSNPVAYGLKASDEIRMDSSSGGAFSLLAEETLSRNGIVFGAAWTNDYSVNHIHIDNRDDISLLRHSKYAQSDLKNTFYEAKCYLEQGKMVLFVGTPCQIVGLRSFLCQEYENLILVDLVCHYVISPKIFRKYLEDNYDIENILSFTMREKSRGWSHDSMQVLLKDGKIINCNEHTDMLQKGFHPRLFMNETCENCKYSEIPRVGDISIGDYWGGLSDPEWNDRKGTSEVLINTEKGEHFFEQIRSKAVLCKEIPLEKVRTNRIDNYLPRHPAQKHFFDLLAKERFNEAVKKSLNGYFDIGLVGDWSVENYGANITYYALYNVLHDQLGYDTLMIERPVCSPWKPKNPPTLFLECPYPQYAIAPYFFDTEQLQYLNQKCSSFIVGSDQLWNSYLLSAFGNVADLHWADDKHLKISYATSFGSGWYAGNEEDKYRLKGCFARFDAISVREDVAVNILSETFDIKASQVLDPVFLCSKDNYIRLAEIGRNYNIADNKFVFSYMLDVDERKSEILKKVATTLNLEKIVITDYAKYQEAHDILGDIVIKDAFLEEWLYNIINCDYMVTDSFHGMCFAIIFHKPFIAIVNNGRGAERFTSLARVFDLESRLIDSLYCNDGDIDNLLDESIYWDHVDTILKIESSKSLKWLKRALHKKKNHKNVSYDPLAISHIAETKKHLNYIYGYSYLDVLPEQCPSGKRTRLALGDQYCLFQVFGTDGKLETNTSLANQDEIRALRNEITSLKQEIAELKKQYESRSI